MNTVPLNECNDVKLLRNAVNTLYTAVVQALNGHSAAAEKRMNSTVGHTITGDGAVTTVIYKPSDKVTVDRSHLETLLKIAQPAFTATEREIQEATAAARVALAKHDDIGA